MRKYFKFNKYQASIICGQDTARFYGSSLCVLRSDMYSYIRGNLLAGSHASWEIVGAPHFGGRRHYSSGFVFKSLKGRFYYTRLS